jgi:hypothetical protein
MQSLRLVKTLSACCVASWERNHYTRVRGQGSGTRQQRHAIGARSAGALMALTAIECDNRT